MASKWASSILQRVAPIGYDLSDDELMEAIDAELREVRECLDGLKQRDLSDGPCWCRSSTLPSAFLEDATKWKHGEACLRTRSLYQRLSDGE